MSKVEALLTRTHPTYAESTLEWNFWEQSYRGGPKYIKANMFQYYKEGDQEFKDRCKRAYRENHSKSIVDKTVSYVYKDGPTRRTDSELLKKFFKNVDGKGKSMDQFMKMVATWAAVFGRIYIVMDKAEMPEEKRTGTALDNLGQIPYLYILFPQEVPDIAFNKDGSVKWALVKEEVRDDDDPFSSSGDLVDQYRLWEAGKWTLYSDDGTEKDSGSTGQNAVPIIAVDSEESLSAYNGGSLLTDIAPIDRAIMNNWSRLDTIVNDQTFSQLIFPIEGAAMTDMLDNEEMRDQYFTLATNRVLLYSAAAGHQVKPEFISPDASQAEFILSMISRQIKHLYSHIGLGASTGEEVKPESGISKAYDLDELSKLLAAMADNLEEAEDRIVDLFSLWTNQKVEAEINYPDDFDVRTLSEEIAQAQDLATLRISETFMKEIEKRIAQKALPKAFTETQEKIEKEIEAKTFPDEEVADAPVFDFDKKNRVEATYDDKKNTGKSRTQKKTAQA